MADLLSTPTVTVVVSTVVRPFFLMSLLQSLALHGGENLSVIIVDNRKFSYSKEDSRSLDFLLTDRPGLPRPTIIRHANGGLSSARNQGAKVADSDYLYFLDDECLVTSTSMRALDTLMRSGVTAAFGGYANLSLDRPIAPDIGSARKILDGGPQVLGAVDMMSGGNLLVRSDAFRRLNGFNERLGRGSGYIELAEEAEFAFRLLQSPETTIIFDPEMEVLHGARSETSSLRWRLRESFHKGRAGVLIRPMRKYAMALDPVTDNASERVSLGRSIRSIYQSLLKPRSLTLPFVLIGAAYQTLLSTTSEHSSSDPQTAP